MGACVIRACSETEALAVLRDPSVLPMLSFYPVALKRVETYLLDEAALVVVMPRDTKAEIHIACRFRDRGRMREAFKSGLEWLRSRGFTEVFTTAPPERKALTNMLRNLGFSDEPGRWVIRWA